MSEAEAAAAGRAAAERFVAAARARGAARVALYAALPDELPTRPLFEALRAEGRECLLPRVLPARRLAFARVDAWQSLRPGRYGIAEPPPDAPERALEEGDWVAVPGRAFDAAGNRLGRGRAYYDRAFPPGAAPGPLLVGLAYELQIVAAVPADSRDRRMDAIVTERAVRWMRRGA